MLNFRFRFTPRCIAGAVSALLVLSLGGCAIEEDPRFSTRSARDDDHEVDEDDGRGAGQSDEDSSARDASSKRSGRSADAAATDAASPAATTRDAMVPIEASGDGEGVSEAPVEPDVVPRVPADSEAQLADAGAPRVTARDAGADNELEALRQLCVDEINRYRATVNAAPLARANDREACSDQGAKADGDSRRAHGSARSGVCPGGAQNTCPGWPVGGRSGHADVAAALKGCLKMMWDEGAPPSSRCTGACYQQHGHYLNMSAPGTKRVACGFYRMANGNYWMNQNFW